MKKILNVIIIVVIGVVLVNAYQTNQQNKKVEEKQLVEKYVNCLNDNFTQRDYCARKVSKTNYLILDQLIEKYGYTYQQNGYDLKVVKK